MNKLVLVFLGIFLISGVFASDIAYVVRDVSNPSNKVIESLDNLRYSYDLIDDSDVSGTDFGEYDMILLGDENINNVPVNEYPSLFMDSDYKDGWSARIGSTTLNSIFALETDFTEEESFDAYIERGLQIRYLSGRKYDVEPIVVKSESSDSYYVVAKKESPSRIFFGIPITEKWSSDSQDLFEDAIKEVIENKKPVCGEFEDLEWNEDSDFQFNLNDYCYDPEGEVLEYEIYDTSDDSHISVDSFEDGLIELSVEENWNGEDWIKFRVSDGEDRIYTPRVILRVLNVNDAPEILSFSPEKEVRLAELWEEEFSIDVRDVDEDELDIEWLLNGISVGEGESYLFSEEKGNYNLQVIVNDGTSDVYNFWSIKVEESSKFSCSELEGFILGKNEVCLGNLLEVLNGEDCCSVAGSPEFDDLERCEEDLNESLEISLEEPNEGEDFLIGNDISIKVKLTNNFDEELDFDIEVSLYNLDEDEVVEDVESSVNLGEGRSRDVSLNLRIPESIESGNDYYIFARVLDEENRCNEEYVRINIEREEHAVVIRRVEIDEASPGKEVEVLVELENLGEEDEEVRLVLENSDLRLDFESEAFILENYEGENKVEKVLSFRVPRNADEEIYSIRVKAIFADSSVTELGRLYLDLPEEEREVEEEQEENKSVSLRWYVVLLEFFIVIMVIAGATYAYFPTIKDKFIKKK
jgi:predicted transcriptional regulator YdeE